ncbi:MAG: rhodanese-related sulfurtransferase, partial [Pseudomonadota bacterium]
MKVAAFYRFLDLENPAGFRDQLAALCEQLKLLGTVLVANEGFNGTLAGEGDAIRRVLSWIEHTLELATPLEPRWSESAEAPFRRLRVKTKKEIVTLGKPDIRPHEKTGSYVTPAEWNALIDRDEVLLIDTRNHYEVEVGSFPNAVDPQTDSFRQFTDFAERLAEESTDRPLAMFCTGGIRCEKATALMMDLGFDEVYHLQGGILEYLKQVPDDDNRWQGECFVFDTRVAVDRDLAEGGYVQCHACRRPLSADDL